MATLAQLTTAYATITRTQPNAAQTIILTDLAARSTTGNITDAQAYAYVISQAQSTTSVAALSYQFFTGKTPTAAGFDFLVNSTTNTSDLNDAYYQTFNLENRYINFSINLGVNGEGRTAFSTTYGSLSFADTVRVAYEKIIGTAQAQQAGINVQASIDNIIGRQAYFTSLAAAGAPAADRDLATKAAVIGYIMAEATKANVGVYVSALNNFYTDAVDGTANFNVDLTTSYGTGSGGAGDPGVPGGVTINYVAATNVSLTQADTAFRSTDKNDVVSGAAVNAGGATIDTAGGNDSVNVLVTGAATATVINLGAGADTLTTTVTEGGTKTITLEGGAGLDTLNMVAGAAITTTAATGTTIAGFETINISTAAGANTIDADAISGATAVWHVDTTGATAALVINDIAEGQFQLGTKSAALTTFDFDAGSKTATVNAGGTFGGITVTDVSDTVTLALSGNSSSTAALTLSSKSLVVTGGKEVNLNAGVVLGGTGSKTVDLSAASAAALTYVTAAGADSGSTDTVTLTAGNDVLNLNLDVAKNSTFTLGGGVDLVTINDATMANLTVNGSGVATTWAKVNGFTADDTLNVVALGNHITSAALTASFIGNSTLEDFLADAAAATVVAGDFVVFEFSGSTYIYQDTAGLNAVATGDGLIQLVGVTGLTVGAAATNDIIV
ncbi:hypothetical protein [Caulobacter sp. NIBR2454]|uniref:hypothetical protein n=1 Tax=Caulobacter sp. NIBR2454 TaxID=3015996 RepID=UPI0022B63F0D|nr:hypothetical protein [Caulobacter sp. NIBR2454]